MPFLPRARIADRNVGRPHVTDRPVLANTSLVQAERTEERLKALMLGALAGNEASYGSLLADLTVRLRAYYGRRLGDAHASAAEDLVQETLIALHARRFTYDVDRPFTAWLYAIARYKLVDHVRAAHGRWSVPLDDMDDLVAPDLAEAATARMDVERLLDGVPARSRGLVRGIKIEGRSVAEMSTESGLSESAVKVAVHRALKAMAKRLKGSGGRDGDDP